LTKLCILKLLYNDHYYSEHTHLRRRHKRRRKQNTMAQSDLFVTEHTICFLPFTIFNSPVSVEINQFSKSD
jgi:hypothetical protein